MPRRSIGFEVDGGGYVAEVGRLIDAKLGPLFNMMRSLQEQANENEMKTRTVIRDELSNFMNTLQCSLQFKHGQGEPNRNAQTEQATLRHSTGNDSTESTEKAMIAVNLNAVGQHPIECTEDTQLKSKEEFSKRATSRPNHLEKSTTEIHRNAVVVKDVDSTSQRLVKIRKRDDQLDYVETDTSDRSIRASRKNLERINQETSNDPTDNEQSSKQTSTKITQTLNAQTCIPQPYPVLFELQVKQPEIEDTIEKSAPIYLTLPVKRKRRPSALSDSDAPGKNRPRKERSSTAQVGVTNGTPKRTEQLENDPVVDKSLESFDASKSAIEEFEFEATENTPIEPELRVFTQEDEDNWDEMVEHNPALNTLGRSADELQRNPHDLVEISNYKHGRSHMETPPSDTEQKPEDNDSPACVYDNPFLSLDPTAHGEGIQALAHVEEEPANPETEKRKPETSSAPVTDTTHNEEHMSLSRPAKSPPNPQELEFSGVTSSREAEGNEAGELISRADELLKNLYSIENPQCPTHAQKMYLKAVEKTNNVKALMSLAELSFRGAENIKRNGTRVNANRGNVKDYLQKVKRHRDYDLVAGRALILEGDILSEKTKKKDLQEALKKYKAALALGAEGSSWKIGKYYYDEHFNRSNYNHQKKYLTEAVKYLSKAVENRCGIAASYLGVIYENENGHSLWRDVLGDFEGKALTQEESATRATQLYFESSEFGSGNGYSDCGTCFDIGYGDVSVNFDSAAYCFKQSFERGYFQAAYNLGDLYERGGASKDTNRIDLNKSIEWYKRGYQVRCHLSTRRLAEMYDYGELGENRRPREACRLYQEAIRFAKRSLHGKGVISDVKEKMGRMLITCILMGEMTESKLRNVDKGHKFLRDSRIATEWEVLKSIERKGVKLSCSTDVAKNHIATLLGRKKYRLLLEYVENLCKQYVLFKNGEMSTSVSAEQNEVFKKMRMFVVDPEIRTELGIAAVD